MFLCLSIPFHINYWSKQPCIWPFNVQHVLMLWLGIEWWLLLPLHICMSLYGCQLWDIDSKYIELFYTAWCKSIRRIFRLHPRTHSKLLPLICKCMNINELLCARLNGFMLKADESDNDLIRACATLAKSGSRSPVSNSFSFSWMLFWKKTVVTEEDLMRPELLGILLNWEIQMHQRATLLRYWIIYVQSEQFNLLLIYNSHIIL